MYFSISTPPLYFSLSHSFSVIDHQQYFIGQIDEEGADSKKKRLPHIVPSGQTARSPFSKQSFDFLGVDVADGHGERFSKMREMEKVIAGIWRWRGRSDPLRFGVCIQ